ncbi:MAG: tRNA 4-thiouridine(8) synthase ThiI [Candidatus Thermoplasmatota archaeon]|nr:tRNA 4-thiouridine(8) synthase ThiI [Candidatus Thermoplasmatota archaeon]
MSGGIDSPVATYLMLKAGAGIMILNMDTRPFGGEDEVEKVTGLASRLKEFFPDRVRLFRAPHGIFLSSFRDHSNRRYMCILCKKAMLDLADLLCDRWDLDGIVTGDSMGQVASQTLHNMAAVSAGVRHPIIRPLIGLDKLDIERIGKEIGTFDISIRRTNGCNAAPRFPITKADNIFLQREWTKASPHASMEQVAANVVELDLR